jgi:putative two-component system response regulator
LDGYQLDRRAIQTIVRSSLLHDIGKVGIPDSILLKPDRLTPDEFEIMKQHTEIGAAALEDASNKSECCEFLQTAKEIARYHHERFDGTGYPSGLRGTSIPLSARIVAVADVFDALTSERVYKKAMDPMDAKSLIESESGNHFDPVIVSAFTESWDQFMALTIQSHGENWAETNSAAEAETIISAGAETTLESGPITFVGQNNSASV